MLSNDQIQITSIRMIMPGSSIWFVDDMMIWKASTNLLNSNANFLFRHPLLHLNKIAPCGGLGVRDLGWCCRNAMGGFHPGKKTIWKNQVEFNEHDDLSVDQMFWSNGWKNGHLQSFFVPPFGNGSTHKMTRWGFPTVSWSINPSSYIPPTPCSPSYCSVRPLSHHKPARNR